MTFEQDRLWLGGRISEMWLHNSWIGKGAGDGKLASYIKNLIRKLWRLWRLYHDKFENLIPEYPECPPVFP
jgi:hypothetical protein